MRPLVFIGSNSCKGVVIEKATEEVRAVQLGCPDSFHIYEGYMVETTMPERM